MKPLSASQVSKWDHCAKAWGWEYLLGKRYSNGGANLGGRIHKIYEDYFQGTPIDMNETMDLVEKDGSIRTVNPGVIAQAGLHLLPPTPQPLVNLESKIEFKAVGFDWHGYVDLMVKGPGPWIVYDHKTTKNLRYAKTKKDLATDPQAIIYGTYALKESGHEQVDLSWTYLQTKGEPKAKAVRLTVLQNDVLEGWDSLARTAEAIAEARDHEDPEKLPRNLLSCGAYGGCPHASYCLTGGNAVSFDKILAQKFAEKGITPSVAPPAPPVSEPPAPPVTVVPGVPSSVPPVEVREVVYLDLKNASRDQLKAEAMRRGLVDNSSKLGADRLRQMLEDAEGAHTAPTNRPSARAVSQAPERVSALPAPPPVPSMPRESEPNPPAPVQSGLSLYIDCLPVLTHGETILSGPSFFAVVYELAADSLKLPDARLADYGKGGAAIRATAKAFIEAKKGELDGKAICLPSAGHADLISILETYAGRIVRGCR